MSQYTIRQAQPKDISFLWDMLYESIHTREGQARPSRDIIAEPSLAKYVEGWGREGDLGFIAFTDTNRPIGSVTLRFFDEASKGYGFVDEETPEIGTAILPEYRGKGIGTALLRRILEEARGIGIKAVSLSVDPDNAAVRLYERFGFREVGQEGTSITMKAIL